MATEISFADQITRGLANPALDQRNEKITHKKSSADSLSIKKMEQKKAAIDRAIHKTSDATNKLIPALGEIPAKRRFDMDKVKKNAQFLNDLPPKEASVASESEVDLKHEESEILLTREQIEIFDWAAS